MSRWVHFVVAVDIDNNQVMLDDDTLRAKFQETLYDDVAEEWREEDYETEYLPALKILNKTKLGKE
jgi:hypothetical protein